MCVGISHEAGQIISSKRVEFNTRNKRRPQAGFLVSARENEDCIRNGTLAGAMIPVTVVATGLDRPKALTGQHTRKLVLALTSFTLAAIISVSAAGRKLRLSDLCLSPYLTS